MDLHPYMFSHITNTTRRRINFEYLAYLDLENTTRTDKEKMLKIFGIYMNMIENIPHTQKMNTIVEV
jgi:hypothetical protein